MSCRDIIKLLVCCEAGSCWVGSGFVVDGNFFDIEDFVGRLEKVFYW